MELALLRDFGIAFALGMLVGMQREWSRSRTAGIRTFPLITLLGAMCAMIDRELETAWLVAAGLLSITIMFWIGNRVWIEADETKGTPGPGLTTEIAGLVMYVVGAAVIMGHSVTAVVTTGAVAALLHWKEPLHRLVKQMGEDDFRVVVQLAIIGMVILPVLPNETYGPYDVLNPFKIWLMVVLIVGISMSAYVGQRLLGGNVGTFLAGIFGGLISSTATTVSYARRSATHPNEVRACGVVILLASTIVFGRVMIEIAIVAPKLLGTVGAPLLVMMGLMSVISLVIWIIARSAIEPPAADEPPSDLKAAVIFGILYALVLFGIAAVKDQFGDTGLYVVAALSGLTDMDAITLSSAQLMKADQLDVSTGWRLILVGAMANLFFKALMVAAIGNRRLLWRIVVAFGIAFAGGVALLMFWPG